MKITLEIPDYDGRATDVIWKQDAAVRVDIFGRGVVITANSDGLISLAKQMMYLAEETVPSGCHVHYDDLFLSGGSASSLIIDKMADGSPE